MHIFLGLSRPAAIKVQIQVEGEKVVQIRNGVSIEEVLGAALAGEPVEEGTIFKLRARPEKMKDGATFRFERSMASQVNRMKIDHNTWGKRVLKFGVETPERATLKFIFTEMQKQAEEELDEAPYFSIYENGRLAPPP
jgi:hypothetical protein